MNKKNIMRIAVGSGLLLLIPLVLQLTIGTGIDGQGFNWKPGDFVFAGIMFFGTGLILSWATKRFPKYKIVAVALTLIAFAYVWAEFAVGVFTNLGS